MAGRSVRLTPEARVELTQAVDYYEQQASLGDDLLSCVEDCLLQIAEAPEAQSPAPGPGAVRLGFVKRFPYRIVFVEDPAEIRVLAVAHKSRRPGYWRSRLEA
ncbi:MAG: type II toxin-antitoxin system RelE/ParE family toxin [Planctomycetota bacterium]